MDPIRAQSRGQCWDRNNQAFRKACFFSINFHQALIGEDIRPPNVKSPAGSYIVFEASCKIGKYIADRNRLDWIADPARCGHDRETFNKIA